MNPPARSILDHRTPKGGYTRETLAKFGVPWPPPKGWLKKLLSETKKNENLEKLH